MNNFTQLEEQVIEQINLLRKANPHATQKQIEKVLRHHFSGKLLTPLFQKLITKRTQNKDCDY